MALAKLKTGLCGVRGKPSRGYSSKWRPYAPTNRIGGACSGVTPR